MTAPTSPRKKNLRIIFLSGTLLLLLSIGTVLAQHHPEMRVQKWTAYMTSELDLTPEQTKQVEAIGMKYARQMAGLTEKKNGMHPDHTATCASRLQIREAWQKEIMLLLTPEQQTKAQKRMAEHGFNSGHHQHGFPGKKGPHSEKRAVIHNEIRTYAQKEIFPIVKEKRKAFDQKISAEDKKTIADLRNSMPPHRKRAFAGAEKHEGRCSGTSNEIAGHKTQGTSPHHAGLKKQHAQMNQLIKKYEQDLKGVMAELDPLQETWTKAIKSIVKKHAPEHAHRMKQHGATGHRMFPIDDHKKNVLFLLMDPDRVVFPMFEEEITGVNVFPNPTAGEGTISFKIPRATEVKIELTDKDGNVLRTLHQQPYDAGLHEVKVNVSNLKSGMYYYRLISNTGTITRRFVKK